VVHDYLESQFSRPRVGEALALLYSSCRDAADFGKFEKNLITGVISIAIDRSLCCFAESHCRRAVKERSNFGCCINAWVNA
jgi:hypothetical protein